MSFPKPGFSVRIVVCDHYLARPVPGVDVIYSEFRGSDIKQVPVLRIFGSTPDGYKACLHVHGVFPYFYIPCPNANPEPQFLYQIAASLDKALNIALKQATSANQHVYKVTLVKGLPFYGFHDKEHLYLKIFLYNPGLMKQAVELCSNGAILGQSLQPHESHLNFTLQFFIDFNLFGMSNIDLQTVAFRQKIDESQNSNDLASPNENQIKRESICYYEADCIASHIINRQRIGRGDGIENPGLEEVWNQEKERRKLLNMSMASKSLSQGRIGIDETESHTKFEKMLLLKLSGLADMPVGVDQSVVVDDCHYPAESAEGSQLFSAVDVSVHLPSSSSITSFDETLRPDVDISLTQDLDATVVDEDIALNCSLAVHHSQVQLDTEDLNLVDILKDLEEEPTVEADSILGTPADLEGGADKAAVDNDDDLEYSQIYNEDTMLFEEEKSEDAENTEESWNDTFWADVSIPQLDGTFDDDHVKKVRKRKMRPFKLGLSRPKKKPVVINNQIADSTLEVNTDSTSTITNETQDVDEINDSSERLDSSQIVVHNKTVKKEITSFINKETTSTLAVNTDSNSTVTNKTQDVDKINDSSERLDSSQIVVHNKTVKKEMSSYINQETTEISQINNQSVTELVDRATVKYEKLEASENYDLINKFEPLPGPSNFKNEDKPDINVAKQRDDIDNDYINDSFESSPEDNKLGFVSFYNVSRIFDLPTSDNSFNGSDSDEIDKEIEVKLEPEQEREPMSDTSEDIKLRYSDSTQENDEIKPCIKSNDLTVQAVDGRVILTPKFRPPTNTYIKETLHKYNIKENKQNEPYYSNPRDAGDKVEIGQLLLKVKSKNAQDQKPFEKVLDTTSIEEWRQLLFLQTNEMNEDGSKIENLKSILAGNRQCILEPIQRPPTTTEVSLWLQSKDNVEVTEKSNVVNKNVTEVLVDDDLDNSQAIGLNENEINSSISLKAEDNEKSGINMNESLQITMQTDGSFLCFGTGESEKEITDSPLVELNFLTVMVLEVHTSVRGDLNPNPAIDPIQVAFITITNDCPSNHFLQQNYTEIIVADDSLTPKLLDRCLFKNNNYNITYVNHELEIIEKVIEIVKKHDPDIMCGYEIEMSSWGYFLERSEALGVEIVMEVSRITEKYRQKRWKREGHDFEGRVIGRVMFNVWRLFRYELALSSYSFESCMYEVLKERVPRYSYAKLAEWWSEASRMFRWIPVEYYLTRLSGTIRMLEKLDIINRTAELARLFGLQWWEVLSRGSQFRVESLMLRAARPLNLIALSPTVKQRAAMRAPECLPLIFEPESRFYTDPVIVLDFQSLYPSVMIAHNYCFSTCIGRVQNIQGDSAYEFGAWRLRISKAKIEALIKNGLVHFSPVGVGFVKPSVRRGVLPALLRRILAARQAVKKSMKMQTDSAVKKAMHSRQLGLKLIANVTYGYTAANFSGRMPCVEVGDSVVSKGRETLERAIKLVESRTDLWNVKVIYGDTDSMFVLVPGATRARAFDIGQQIADAVTADNPSPIALKLEKVYQPCILQTKKRYVGFMYESADQPEPVYEAKGIETVRRDGCPAGVKLLQNSLIELFRTGDVSRVKAIAMRLLSSLCSGVMPPQQLFFTREYRGLDGYKGPAAPPQFIAQRLIARDPRALPRTGERMQWLVTGGAPTAALGRLARSPRELARAPAPPHVTYYACRVLLPPLHRCLSLLGVDVFKWWLELGYTRDVHINPTSSGSIARYLWRERCALCGRRSTKSVCGQCAATPHRAAGQVMLQYNTATKHVGYCEMVCSSCAGNTKYGDCENVECPVLWRRQSAQNKLNQVQDIIKQLPPQLRCNQSIDF